MECKYVKSEACKSFVEVDGELIDEDELSDPIETVKAVLELARQVI